MVLAAAEGVTLSMQAAYAVFPSYRTVPTEPRVQATSLPLRLFVAPLLIGFLVGSARTQSQPGERERPSERVSQDPARPSRRPEGAESAAPIPTDLEGGLPFELSLQAAIELGVRRNLDLKAARLLPLLEAENLRQAQAFFEPEFFGNFNGGQTNTPSRNVFQPSRETSFFNSELGLRQQTSTGGLFELSWRPSILLQTAGVAGFPEQLFTSEFQVTATQPLLRGGWSGFAKRDVRSGETALTGAKHRYERTEQQTILDIVNAYWELVFAREDFRVVVAALELAQEQLRITTERIRVRELAELDRISDEAEVALRREELIRAENLIRQREDELRRLIFDDTDGLLWQRNLRPTTPIETAFVEPPEVWQAIARDALIKRPDLQALRADVNAAEIDLDVAKSNLLPQLDLVGSYSADGVNSEFDPAFRDSAEAEFDDWSVQLLFSVPLGNQAAKAARDRALLQVERTRRLLYAAEMDVEREVRDAVRQLRSLAESVVAASESVRLAETNLYTERQRFEIGEATLFEIQQRNQQLREARQRLRRNQVDFRRAEANLEFVRGRLVIGRL